MRVFVTGATGFIGTSIVQELLTHGHQVLGLARSDASAQALLEAGAEVIRGDLNDLESLKNGAEAADGVIHAGFVHDFANFLASVETDRVAVDTLGRALEGTGKPLVVTFGTAILPPGELATEEAKPIEGHPLAGRGQTEKVVLDFAQRGVRAIILRLPPTVHGAGDHGFIPVLVNMAGQSGFAAYVGEGANRWGAVHRHDAAKLYRLALEKAEPGTVLHAVAEEGIPMRQIQECIGAGLGLPVRSLPPEEAAAHFTWFTTFVGIDNPTSRAATRAKFAWNPTGPGLLDDMRENYFSPVATPTA